MAFEPAVADLAISVDGEWVRIGRPKVGWTYLDRGRRRRRQGQGRGPAGARPAPAGGDAGPRQVDYAAGSRTGDGGFMARYSQLQNAAADELGREAAGDRTAGLNARMGLARFLVGSELNYEAIGVLNLMIRHHQELAGDPEFRGLRGAARAMVGRYKEAETDFSVPVLADDPPLSLWRGYAALPRSSDWQA